MPLTAAQIEQLKKKAKARGFDPKEFDNAINQYQQGGGFQVPTTGQISTGVMQPAGYSPQAMPQTSAPQQFRAQTPPPTPQTPGVRTNTTQPTQEKGFVASFIEGLVRPAVNYTKFVGEAGAQFARAVSEPNMFKADEIDAESQQLQQRSRELIQQAKNTTDKAEKQRLLEESRQIDAQISKLGSKAGQIGNMQKSFLVDENKIATRGDIAMTGAKATAGGASYFVPGGTGVVGAAKAGATAGALFGFSEGEGFNVEDVIYGAVGGGVGGAAVPVAGKVLGKGKNAIVGGYKKLSEKFGKELADTAAQRINKASPSMWQKAVEDHGIDLNELTKKIVTKASAKVKGGVGYDDLLGPISERGRGGLFKTEMEAAESAISKSLKNVTKNTKFTINEIIDELNAEKKLLSKLPGNEKNIAALDEFVAGFQAQYGKGITPKQALTLKRVADSQFGRAVADENTGSAVAQAQKMVANALRSKLKKLLPEVADALDSETELYTIQPVLNRARATINTQGSEIRVGSLKGKGLFELITSIPDAYLSDPKRASKLVTSAGSGGVDDATVRTMFPKIDLPTENVSKIGGIFGSRVSGTGQPQDNMNNDSQYEQSNPQQKQESSNVDSEFNQNNPPNADILTQTPGDMSNFMPVAAPSPMNPFGNLTKRQALSLALSQGASMADVKEISELYDLVGAQDVETINTETMKMADGLRQEYFARTKETGFLEIVKHYRTIESTSNSAYGDLSLIFAYMKMLDPGSVVREAEFDNAAQAASYLQQTYGKALKLTRGNKLTDQQRAELKSEAKGIFNNYQNTQAQVDAFYQGYALQFGIDPSLLGVGLYDYQSQPTQPTTDPTQDQKKRLDL